MGDRGDTIAAVATPAGPGAIGILRLSGPGAADIAAACFRPLGRKGLWTIPPARWYMAACWTVRAKSSTRCCVLTAAVRPAILGRTQRSSTATAPPWSSPLGLEALFAQGPARQARGVHPAGLSQRAAGPGPGGRVWPTCWTPGAGRGPPRGGPAVRRTVPENRGHILPPWWMWDGPLPRGAGLSGRGHRPLHPGAARPGPGSPAAGPGGPAVHLSAGPPFEPGREMRHRGAAQCGQVLPCSTPWRATTGPS